MCWRLVGACELFRMCVPARLSFLARGVFMEVFLCLVFVITTTAGVPVQTLNEILQSVNNEEGLLRADLESIYAFTHKSWNPHILENEVSQDMVDPVSRDPRVYVVLDDDEESNSTSSTTSKPSDSGKREVDPWSLIWYMASFGGLVIFFLVVSCSECCCSKRTSPSAAAARSSDPPPEVTQWVDETPPPPYDLFAPPSYDTLFYGTLAEGKDKCEVYVVPIHSHMVAPRSAPT
ncbi:uncharacterized protein [Periplaneta americana]|uniref:uncharacterized protein n=1 Tax=Periplaneta americana TaxID=6978 RepID=UPI0037E73FB9